MTRCPSRKYLWRCDQDIDSHRRNKDGELIHTNTKDDEVIESVWTTGQQDSDDQVSRT